MCTEITALIVKLDRNGSQDFALALTSGGGVSRAEPSDEDEDKPIMLIGKSKEDLLGAAVALLSPKVTEWFGKDIQIPGGLGDRCELTIAVYDAAGLEKRMLWRYWSGSQLLPAFISDFVSGVMDITDPWFEDFKRTIESKEQGPRQ